jgi:Mn2+/Fe2+ NRAMP family transporter
MEATTTTAAAPEQPAQKRGRFGPAFVTAALVFGPGSITTASSLGASFSYDLVWVPVLATILMLCFVNLSVRIGLTTDRSPVATVSAKLGRIVGIPVGLGAFLVAASFQAGNSVGTGAASQVLFGGNTALFAALFTALAIGFLWLPRFYRNLERTMVVIIVAMLVIYVVTAVISRPDLGQMAKGLLPSIPSGASALVVAAAATTFSIVGAFYQIQLVREKGWAPAQFPEARRDAALGSVILGTLSMVIMVAAAAVLNPLGATVSSPADMAVILEPTLGQGATVLFALGLWAAAFSSLLGNSTIGGSMLAGALGIDRGGLDSKVVKLCITAVLLLGGIVAVVFGGIPVQLILTAQAVTILVVPMIGIALVVLARSRDRGSLRIGAAQLTLALFGILFLLALAVQYIVSLFG